MTDVSNAEGFGVANPRLRPIKPLAFAAALILAPFICALPFALILWVIDTLDTAAGSAIFILAIPVFAILFGGIQYLTFGGVAFWMALRRGRSTAFFGFLSNLASLPVVTILSMIFADNGEVIALPIMCLFFGSVFAPLWGAIFGSLYRRFAGFSDNGSN